MFSWKEGRSLFWQIIVAISMWSYIVALHWSNDGLWYQGDSPRHAANGLFWWDFVASLPVNPLQFTVSYFARYPVINPTAWPPVFYFFEGSAYKLFGVSPFVAKGLVLSFMLAGILYMIAWLRRGISQQAGWGGILFALQPGIITWSHAVMLTVPSAALSIAALYHCRRWLERPTSPHIYLAALLGLLAILTYLPVAVLAAVMLAWVLAEQKVHLLIRPRLVGLAALSLIPLGAWAFVAMKWAPSHRAAALYLGQYPVWKLAAWTFYVEHLPYLITTPLVLVAFSLLGLALRDQDCRKETRLALLWLVLSYIWFSTIAVKEPRHALLLIPPLVCIGTAGIVAALRSFTAWRGQQHAQIVPAALLVLLALHCTLASFVRVPRVSGFRDIVEFARTIAPAERVFYDGAYNGVFSFYLRAGDPGFRSAVSLGSKLLYATRTEPQFGLIEFASSSHDVVDRLKTACGCRFLFVERQIAKEQLGIAVVHTLRDVLPRGGFRLIRTFAVQAADVSDVDVYEQIGEVTRPSSLELPFPTLGPGVRFNATPLQR